MEMEDGRSPSSKPASRCSLQAETDCICTLVCVDTNDTHHIIYTYLIVFTYVYVCVYMYVGDDIGT